MWVNVPRNENNEALELNKNMLGHFVKQNQIFATLFWRICERKAIQFPDTPKTTEKTNRQPKRYCCRPLSQIEDMAYRSLRESWKSSTTYSQIKRWKSQNESSKGCRQLFKSEEISKQQEKISIIFEDNIFEKAQNYTDKEQLKMTTNATLDTPEIIIEENSMNQNISINKTPGSSKENRHNDSEDYCPYEFTDTSSPIDNYIRLISKDIYSVKKKPMLRLSSSSEEE